MQRLFDIIFSTIAILLLAPLLLVVMFILRVTGEGEIFYSQSRVGKSGNQIKIFKFATMLKNSPNLGTGTVTLNNDPRILPFGRFLRKSKINELPQLFNIILGQMSIIGPRPQTHRCFKAFPESSQTAIMSVRPGLSGVGSIYFRNEELMMNDARNANKFYDGIIMPYKGLLEEWYVKNQSLTLYFVLIMATVSVVLLRKIPFRNTLFSSIPRAPKELVSYI